MNEILPSSPVSNIYGIGPEIAKKLLLLGIETVYDLVTYFPRRYDDYRLTKKVTELAEGEQISVYGRICSSPKRNGYRQTSPCSFYVSDDTGRVLLSFFNSSYIIDKFHIGDQVFVHGIVSSYKGKVQFVNPVIEKNDIEGEISLIRPVYRLTAGITSSSLRRWIKTGIKAIKGKLKDVIPESIIMAEGLPTMYDAFEYIHFPRNFEEASLGRMRFCYEELILLGIGMKLFLNKSNQNEYAPIVIPREKELISEGAYKKWRDVLSNLKFELTTDQMNAIKDIQKDLMSSKPMNRLVQGDVGSGKTAIAILAMVLVSVMGKQSCLLAPTSVLAKQHFDIASELLEGTGITPYLLLGKHKKSDKNQIKKLIETGEAKILIGTHALLSDDVSFVDLALVIADEQHRFGVKQREKLLLREGQNERGVHNLVMTATPIPRTLGMVLYGDMDTSIIKMKPKGRIKVTTNFIEGNDNKLIYQGINAAIKSGGQAYVVCPKIDDKDEDYLYNELFLDSQGEEDDLISVTEMEKRIKNNSLLKENEVGVIYGRMKDEIKLEVMDRFIKGDIKILISTTVIEVGVNNPNANLIVIMNADRFGLSTLHQLRGRVGRGTRKSYCFLASSAKSEIALQRIEMMCTTDDGFELATKDLELRGPGDFFGVRQHGIPSLRAANLLTDAKLASYAVSEVNKIFDSGEESIRRELLSNIEYMFKLRFEGKLGTL